MKINIIKAISTDAEKIAPLFNDYRQFYQQPSDVKKALSFISERLNNNDSIIFFAQDENGVVLGFTQLYPSFSSVSAKSILILNDLFVDEDARGLGIGKLLLESAKDFAISRGDKGIALETTPDNTGAQALYQNLGYDRVEGYLHYFLSLDPVNNNR